jgi:hypothetical protein
MSWIIIEHFTYEKTLFILLLFYICILFSKYIVYSVKLEKAKKY